MSKWLRLAALGMGLVTIGVACATRRAAPPVLGPADPAEVFAAVRRREDAILSLRARFSVTVQQDENVRRAEGVLLVKKPDRFRLRLLSPFGFTVFDYVTSGAHMRMELPLEGKRLVDDEIATQSAFSPVDLRQAFLRGAAAFPGYCTPQAAGAEVSVECRDAPGDVRREIRIARATATVSQEISFAGDVPRVVMTFAEYRTVEGIPLPFAIELRAPARHVTMQIALRSYDLNPVLADTLFGGADAG